MEPQEHHIEIRSEEIQEIVGKSPAWIIRWGITLLFVIIVVLLALSYLLRFPDTISSRVMVTSKVPPVSIVAKATGRVHFLIADKERVAKQQHLGFIINTAKLEDVMAVSEEVEKLKKDMFTDRLSAKIKMVRLPRDLTLGEIQQHYLALLKSIQDFQLYNSLKSSEKQVEVLSRQLSYYNTITSQARKQAEFYIADEALVQKKLSIDSQLAKEKVLAPLEYDASKRNLIQSKIANEAVHSTITNNLIQASMLESQITQLKNTEQSNRMSLILSLESAIKELEHQIQEWQDRYLLTAPYAGEINFSTQWSNDQTVNLNDEIIRLVPENNTLFCKAFVPINGSGKMATGQKVNIRLDNYPYMEYGVVKGRIQSISSIPINNFYVASIGLPEGLLTTYRKHLPFKQEMQGSAEIITEDRTVLGRIFNQFRALLTTNN